jgi:hypothetical protein
LGERERAKFANEQERPEPIISTDRGAHHHTSGAHPRFPAKSIPRRLETTGDWVAMNPERRLLVF